MRPIALCLLVLSAACSSATAPAPPVVAPSAPVVAARTLPEPDSIRWVRDSAEYRAATMQAYVTATARIEAAAPPLPRGSWAVVLDADETVISNLAYQAERARQGLPYSAESWQAWVHRREATPIAGAAAFLRRVRDLGGRIAIVTNRLQAECADTEAVFATNRLPYDAMLCRPNDGPSDKNPRFDAVAAGTAVPGGTPLKVLAFVGDNVLDFPRQSQALKAQGESALAEFGVMFFILPNPMYGSWQ